MRQKVIFDESTTEVLDCIDAVTTQRKLIDIFYLASHHLDGRKRIPIIMNPYTTTLAVLLFLAPSLTFSEDPFACVDPAVAEAFLGPINGARSNYSTELSTTFSGLAVPAGFSLVGSELAGWGSTVVFTSTSPSENASESIRASLAKLGWMVVERKSGAPDVGFRERDGVVSGRLCKESEPASDLVVIAYTKTNQTFVHLGYSRRGTYCDPGSVSRTKTAPHDRMKLLPELNIPNGIQVKSSRVGGINNVVEAHAELVGLIDNSALINHLSNELRDSGWIYETAWSSRNSAGSIWHRVSDSDGELVGSLKIVDGEDNLFRVSFSITPLSDTTGVDHGSWSASWD